MQAWDLAPVIVRRSRLGRQAFSESSVPSSPRDSGYDSSSASPECLTPRSPHHPCYASFFDGNDSSRALPSSNDEDEDDTELKTAGAQRSATLPRPTTHRRPGLPAAFFFDRAVRPARRNSDLGPLHGPNSLRHPDRFVPSRNHHSPLTEKFRTTRPPHELTSNEKLLRNHEATPDPFIFRPRRVTPRGSNRRANTRSDTRVVPRTRTRTVLGPVGVNEASTGMYRRIPSHGSIWSVGGIAPRGGAIDNGHGILIQSGTNAPLYTTSYAVIKEQTEDEVKHKGRLAAALEMDLTSRVLGCDASENHTTDQSKKPLHARHTQQKSYWDGAVWINESRILKPQKTPDMRHLPIAPFKVLDAPQLRDDFYCSILAYSPVCQTLAVGLGDCLYSWSEPTGVRLLNGHPNDRAWLTSIAFSSTDGQKCILAYGRSDRTLGLVSMYEAGASRMLIREAAPIACLSFRPRHTIRPSRNQNNPGVPVKTKDLLVGDEQGVITYYVVEWPESWEVERDNWRGEITRMARISVHRQQICGLAWSKDGRYFATGGNDNLCCLFEVDKVLRHPLDVDYSAQPAIGQPLLNDLGDNVFRVIARDPHSFHDRVHEVGPAMANCRWQHGAAVKAIAFCPWQDGLVATGGGSNDKCIHFFHTTSGAALATISVSAQVTSLIWSTTRREIAATYGYAQPDHPIRVAIFSWPECKQVGAIPWEGKHRALYAIPYPKGPQDTTAASSRTTAEGCIIIAASDESIKFHEVWAADKRATTSGVGMLGGSDILEDLEGIDKEGDVIR